MHNLTAYIEPSRADSNRARVYLAVDGWIVAAYRTTWAVIDGVGMWVPTRDRHQSLSFRFADYHTRSLPRQAVDGAISARAGKRDVLHPVVARALLHRAIDSVREREYAAPKYASFIERVKGGLTCYK